jgi:hypothetical protein
MRHPYPTLRARLLFPLAYAVLTAEIPPLDCLAINQGRQRACFVGNLRAQPYIAACHVLSACCVCNVCIAILTFAHLCLASLFWHGG